MSFWNGVSGLVGGAAGSVLGGLLRGSPWNTQQNQGQGDGQQQGGDMQQPPPPMRVIPASPGVYDLSNRNIPGIIANQNRHMQKAADMAANTSRAVGETMRQNANRVTANRMKQMELAGAQAMASGEHARANAIAEQARQDALARQYEASEKTKRMVQAMRML